MSTQITLEYLSKLLNKPMAEEVEVMLSSAQKARVHGWLINNGISFNESVLNGKFTIDRLLSGSSNDLNYLQPSSLSHLSLPTQLDVVNAQMGIDIQRVDELFPQGLPFDPKVDKELMQIFTAKELSYAQSKVDPDVTLAGLFCAKEAIQKVSNITKNLNELEVLPDESGKPKCNGFTLSISHSGNYAIAIATSHSADLGIKKISVEGAENLSPTGENFKQGLRARLRMVRITDIIFLGLIGFLYISRYYN